MRVVLDTNIIVSSFLVALGAPARIVAHWRARLFDLVVSPVLLAEYKEALGYERVSRRHRMSREQIAAEVADIAQFAILVEPELVPDIIPADPDDDHVLACAVAGGAGYIVSGDSHLLDLREYQGIRILTPAAFVALLAEEH